MVPVDGLLFLGIQILVAVIRGGSMIGRQGTVPGGLETTAWNYRHRALPNRLGASKWPLLVSLVLHHQYHTVLSRQSAKHPLLGRAPSTRARMFCTLSRQYGTDQDYKCSVVHTENEREPSMDYPCSLLGVQDLARCVGPSFDEPWCCVPLAAEDLPGCQSVGPGPPPG
jgi:hypothetical protein